jgi:putative transposase
MAQSSIDLQALPTRSDLRKVLHEKVLEAIQAVIEEELTDLIGADRYERSARRRGQRNGSVRREVTTQHGPMELQVPRARITEDGDKAEEFHSKVLPRYARRTREVDEVILGVYLAGANTRRIRLAMESWLGTANLSKSAISRVVSRLRQIFEAWDGRDLSSESYPLLFLDAINLKVRMARRVISVPVLVALGVDEEGYRRLVALRLAAQESGGSWGELVADLQKRGLPSPVLVLSDGHRGLTQAIKGWPEAKAQRCTVHKLQNLREHCPPHARNELRRDFHRIIYARDGMRARKAYRAFLSKWTSLCPAVARSLEEGGEKLLTFYEFPRRMWRGLRSTNSVESLNREFRRRTKTQGSFSTETAAVTLLYGLVAFGQIQMRRIDGYQHLKAIVEERCQEAA